MVTLELKMLPGEASATWKFLQSKLKSQVQIRGEELVVDDEKADEVKLLLKKFLHQEGLEGYRVLSEKGILKVVPDELEKTRHEALEEKIKGVGPFPPLSTERLPLMQTVYPNYGSSPILTERGKKKKR